MRKEGVSIGVVCQRVDRCRRGALGSDTTQAWQLGKHWWGVKGLLATKPASSIAKAIKNYLAVQGRAWWSLEQQFDDSFWTKLVSAKHTLSKIPSNVAARLVLQSMCLVSMESLVTQCMVK